MKIAKTKTVQFRITEKEYENLQEYIKKNGSKSRSDFFRKVIMKKLKLS